MASQLTIDTYEFDLPNVVVIDIVPRSTVLTISDNILVELQKYSVIFCYTQAYKR